VCDLVTPPFLHIAAEVNLEYYFKSFYKREVPKIYTIKFDDALVTPANHLKFRKCNMRLKTNIKPKEATFQVVLDALALTPFYQVFLITTEVLAIYIEILQICPKIPRQEFEDLILEQEVLSFIRDRRHTGDITYLTDVNVDYLHQPWRAFATVINKLKTKMLRRQTRCHIPDSQRHEDTQVYGTLLPKHLTNQAMLDSKAYQTYYTFASGEKAPKPKLKSKAKVAKPDKKKKPTKKRKAKGLVVLFEVSLSEAEQLKLATKRSKKDFHMSHVSGSDEGTGTMLGVLDVPTYESESEKGSWGDSKDDGDNDDDGDSDDHEDDSDDERTESNRDEIPNPKLTIPPSQSSTQQSAGGKLYLILNSTTTDIENRLHLFNPPS
ncbi:hypothetical protein Tco_1435575, partial [Tanacetum coccineum]